MIPDEAVEAAADLVLRMIMDKPLKSANPLERELALRQGRLILEAAAPHMQSSGISATEIEAVAHMIKAAKADGWDEGQKSGMRHADRLVAAAKIGRPDLTGPPSPNPYRKDTK
jgi:hypothetical protein